MKDFFMLINRNLFKKLKRSILLTALVVLGVNMAQAQTLEGAGTVDNPYLINSAAEWNTFAGNSAYWASGVYVRLDANIPTAAEIADGTTGISTMVGTSSNKYSGIFDGNWHILNFEKGTVGTPFTEEKCAPFRYIDGATIKKLTVTGKIVSKKKFMAGFVAWAESAAQSKSYITNCTSSIEIDCSQITGSGSNYKSWDCSVGGFVGQIQGGDVVFENCLFDGNIHRGTGSSIQPKANRGAGFVSYVQANYAVFTNCLMAGIVDLCTNFNGDNHPEFSSTFGRNNRNKFQNGTSYYTHDYGDVPVLPNCDHPSLTKPEVIYRTYTVDTTYYVSVVSEPEMSGIMVYPGYPVEFTLTYYGRRLVKDTDYTIVIKKRNNETGLYENVDIINDVNGEYKVNIDGISAKGYYGSVEYDFRFLSEEEKWYNLRNLVRKAADGATITLEHDYMGLASDTAVIIDKNLTINLNGHTIDRGLREPVSNGQVIRISAGKNVTISNGTITGGYSQAQTDYKPADDATANINDAGGIYNMGNLVLNNVNVVGNKCIKHTDSPTNAASTARGGGVYTGSGSSFTMTGGKVSQNEAKGGGGGVYCYMPASFSMTNVEISYNDSESKGGGLRIRTSSAPAADTACLVNCRIENNRATETDLSRSSDGGGVFMQEGKLKMVECTIGGAEGKGNQSAFAGAGFYQNGGYTVAKNCTISYNSSYTQHDRMYGGGICVHAGTYLMDSGSITDNHSYRDGGGVYIYHGAHFKVKGRVTINDNLRTRPGAVPENTENNAYTDDGALIEIVGPLTSDSRIHITGHGFGGTYTKGKDTYNVPDSVIVPDGKYQLVTVDEQGHAYTEVVMAPYEWYKGAWGIDENGDTIKPTMSTNIVINKAVELEPGEIGYADSIRYVNGSIVLKDGSQLICKDGLTKNSPPVEALFDKNIKGVEESDGGWYAISIPTDGVKIWDLWEHNTNLVNKTSESGTDDDMDLLRYFEPHHYWDSYSDGSGQSSQSWLGKFTDTENGRGYLYRNRNDKRLTFYGFMNFGDVTYTVHAESDDARMLGWNIIGNPYPHGIYKGAGTAIPNGTLLNDNFYFLTKEGGWTPARDNIDSIGVCQGILVSAKATGDLVMHDSITKAAPAPSKKDGEKTVKNSIKFTVSNSQYEEKAYVLFDKGTGLRKVDHLNEDIPMLYIRRNNEDYAIASVGDNAKSVNLEFWAKTLSAYTMNIDIEGEFRYLHLIDKITGDDIDLLVENKYKFIGAATDDTDRFIVLMDYASDSETEGFAYQNGNDIIVCGEGELQMFDVAGRLVSTQYVSGVEAVRKQSQGGVYILRLLGTDVKTQKIVVK